MRSIQYCVKVELLRSYSSKEFSDNFMNELPSPAQFQKRVRKPASMQKRLSTQWTMGGLVAVIFLAGFAAGIWACGHAMSPFQAFAINFDGAGERITGILLALTALFSLALVMRSRHIVRRLTASEARAKEVAGRDILSGLPNRFLFNELVDAELARCRRKNLNLAVFYLDIDHFKQVNDKYGHEVGDQMIVAVTRRIANLLRSCDSFARLGGDEFAILQAEVSEPRDCASLAARVVKAMSEPFPLNGTQILSSVSIGIAIYPNNAYDREDLLRVSDLALYRAKHQGRNRFAFFESKMGEELRLRQNAEDELRCAIENDELALVYQPIVSAQTGRMVGAEALVRWQHKTQGLLTADHFISLAETRGLIVPLGEWVLRQACTDAKRWPGLHVAVNVSPVQFRQKDFVASVQRILTETAIEPHRIELELTEGVVVSDADQAEKSIMDLRSFGIRMALDDFGNGYSSLIYLRRFAFDKIKIDRFFLEAMEPASESAIIIESIVKLGRALGLTVTAEGIESDEQIRFLKALGCDELQGFFFSPPVSREEIDAKYGEPHEMHVKPEDAPLLSHAG
jgi:diguanylate cyclase (GGDEF)-like protein